MPDYLGTGYLTSNADSMGSFYRGNYGFTTTEDMQRYIGAAGVALITDDLESSIEIDKAIEEAILEAEDWMLSYLLHRYDPEGLFNVNWVERRMTEAACFFLFQRRGQSPPVSLSETFARIEENLNQIIDNDKMTIPGAIPRVQGGPRVSNYAVDNRAITNRLRVTGRDSMGTHPNQRQLRGPYGTSRR